MSQTPWSEIVDALSPLNPREKVGHGGLVIQRRTWNPQSKYAIWKKTIQRSSNPEQGFDLCVFAEWEFDLAVRYHNESSGKGHCYDLAEAKAIGSHVRDGEKQRRRKELQTRDAGPDLFDWEMMRPSVGGRQIAHPFVRQRHYLELTKGILIALLDIHTKNLVHCDFHPGNITLPARLERRKKKKDVGEYIEITPLWDKICIIDLDKSASRAVRPYAMLPLEFLNPDGRPSDRMSVHLQKRLVALDAYVRQKNADASRYDREFWSMQPEKWLGCFTTLDWREDFYQLGYWLKQIRDGGENGTWGAGQHVEQRTRFADINKFIQSFPEELMAWGSASQMDWDPDLLTSKILPPEKKPHLAYIGRIEELLRQLPSVSDTFALYRRNHDGAYAELEKRKALKKQQLQRFWKIIKTHAQQMLRLSKPMAVLAAAVLLAYPAYLAYPAILQKWNARAPEPVAVAPLPKRAATLAQSLIDARGGAQEYTALLAVAAPDEAERKALTAAAYPIVYQRWRAAAVGTAEREAALKPLLWLLPHHDKAAQAGELEKLGGDYLRVTDGYTADPLKARWWLSAGPASPDVTGARWLRETSLLAEAGIFSARIYGANATYVGKGEAADPDKSIGQLAKALESLEQNSLTGPQAGALAVAFRTIEQATVFESRPEALKAAIPALKHLAKLDFLGAHDLLGYLSACAAPLDPALAHRSFGDLAAWATRNGALEGAAKYSAATRLLDEQNPELCDWLLRNRRNAARKASQS